MFRAWQIARASGGTRHWIEVLYGVRPGYTTVLEERLTYQLMLEEQRQIEMSAKVAKKEKVLNAANADGFYLHESGRYWVIGFKWRVRIEL
ncbi:hypothetical protein KJZ99_00105 [bacterium]|nr:hypothetical protein [bacterium]